MLCEHGKLLSFLMELTSSVECNVTSLLLVRYWLLCNYIREAPNLSSGM